MSEYPPHVHALLEAARQGHDPSPADAERVRAALLASLRAAQVTLPAASAHASTGAATGGAVGKLSLVSKAFLLSAFVGGASFGGYAWLRQPPRTTDAGLQARALIQASEDGLPRDGAREGEVSAVGDALRALHSAPAPTVAAEPRAVADASRALHGAPAPTVAAEPRADGSAQAELADSPSSALDAAPSLAPHAAPQRARWTDPASGAARRVNRLRGAHSSHGPTTGPTTVGPERARVPSADHTSRALAAADSAQPVARTAQDGAQEQTGTPHEPAPVAQGAEPQGASRQAELALIRETLTSLRDRAPQRALRLLEEHASRFPQGVFAHERRGLRAVALCEAGERAQGRRERASFLRQDAQSPLAARVRKACEEEPSP